MVAIDAPGVKIAATPAASSVADVGVGMMPPPNTSTSSRPALAQLVHHPREQREVRAREHRQPDGVGVLLQRGLGHLLGRLEQPGVDHLEARVTQGAGDHFDAPVVAVEAGFGHDDSIGTLHGGHPKWMPVSRSDPRRATIIGIGGVIVGVALIVDRAAR